MRVRDVMTAKVHVLERTDSVRRAARLLAEHGVGGMPVVDGGRVVGVLSETDIFEALKVRHRKLHMLMPPEISFGISFVEVFEEREAAKALEDIGDTSVEDVMTKDVATVAPDDPIERAIRLMVERKVHRVVVLDTNAIAGILTRGDVLRGFFRSLSE